MAKFNIEVELDWMDEEAQSIDDELRERIVKGVENALLEKGNEMKLLRQWIIKLQRRFWRQKKRYRQP